jgi:DnaK suppressor protein
MTNDLKVRYSDEDLAEFKVLIEGKKAKAQEELDFTRRQMAELNETGFNQQGGDMYDDSGAHADLEFMQRMSARQEKYIDDLQKALFRIQNKTYGVCIVTGTLIPKERLRAVPHATKTVDGKNIANASRIVPTEGGSSDPFSTSDGGDRPTGKPIGDKVRLPQSKRGSAGGSEDWEPDNESIEGAGYRPRKEDDDE